MSVYKIEEYKQKDGADILKVIMNPVKNLPNGGYFFCDADAIDLVESRVWFLHPEKVATLITASNNHSKLMYFHRELAYEILGYYPKCIDHISGCTLDNTDANLNAVTVKQNVHNKVSRGYNYSKIRGTFSSYLCIYSKMFFPYKPTHMEIEACKSAFLIENYKIKEALGQSFYTYNFLEDRRKDLDLVNLERTGIISAEEATYRHVIRYAKDNAWYYYRYNLEQYFKDNHIPIPDFTTDERGFMRHPITNQLLCPF